eukprot:scaffold2213_cov444-Prasinococcus_capsulatus_cf.AAC.22
MSSESERPSGSKAPPGYFLSSASGSAARGRGTEGARHKGEPRGCVRSSCACARRDDPRAGRQQRGAPHSSGAGRGRARTREYGRSSPT